MSKDLRELEQYFDLKFNNFSLLERAMTHSSFANENNKISNERLEFVGDAVLDLAVAKFLFDKLDEAEGVLTKKRAQEVCEQSLFEYAKEINLGDYLLLGKGEEMSGGREKPALLADAFEALLGAVYIDKGYKETYKILNKIVFPTILKNIDEEDNDYKSKLQELVQSDKRTLEYKIVSETGPAHNREFTARVYMDESIIMGEGSGKSKKEAEQNAAKSTLKKLAKSNRG
jgi:ribonuclease-3